MAASTPPCARETFNDQAAIDASGRTTRVEPCSGPRCGQERAIEFPIPFSSSVAERTVEPSALVTVDMRLAGWVSQCFRNDVLAAPESLFTVVASMQLVVCAIAAVGAVRERARTLCLSRPFS